MHMVGGSYNRSGRTIAHAQLTQVISKINMELYRLIDSRYMLMLD